MIKSKIDLSFYDFVGILVPGITFLYCLYLFAARVFNMTFLDFAKIGDSVVFIVLSYVTTEVLLHPLGNAFETLYWKFWKGKPTSWLTRQNERGPRSRRQLFKKSSEEYRTSVVQKVHITFKGRKETDDYGMSVYRFIDRQDVSKRANVFNANYSLFRAMSIVFVLLGGISCYFDEWLIAGITTILLVFSVYRMDRFAVRYAEEIFDCFNVHNLESQEAINLIQTSKF